MAKIAMIGAGSLVFCKTLMADMLATPALAGSEYRLMALTHKRLDKMHAFVKRMIKDNGVDATVTATTDRREALKDADYVVIMIQVGGVDAFRHDYEIPLNYGVDQCIGDTLGPGGVFRALRHIPALMDIAADMRELCPNALLLNYANPMAVVLLGARHRPGPAVRRPLPRRADHDGPHRRYVGEKKDEIDFLAAGINHMAWFLRLEKNGRDLYPAPAREVRETRVLRQRESPRRGHASLRLLHDRKHRPPLASTCRTSARTARPSTLYCDQPDFGGESGAYYKYGKTLAEKFDRHGPALASRVQSSAPEARSTAPTSSRRTTPERSSASTATSATTASSPTSPPAAASRCRSSSTASACIRPLSATCRRSCAALNMTNVLVQGLAVQAALAGDPELAMQAVALDPLTSAVLTLEEIRRDGR